MVVCPHCSHENIEGADSCEECQQSLMQIRKEVDSSTLEQSIAKDRISLLSPREPLLVEADAPVSMVLKLLADHSVGCAIVVDSDRQIAGIFSERDALMKLNVDFSSLGDRPVSEFMTPDPESLRENDKIAFALHKMDLGGYRHVPIIDGERVTGIISVRDIICYITDHLLAEV